MYIVSVLFLQCPLQGMHTHAGITWRKDILVRNSLYSSIRIPYREFYIPEKRRIATDARVRREHSKRQSLGGDFTVVVELISPPNKVPPCPLFLVRIFWKILKSGILPEHSVEAVIYTYVKGKHAKTGYFRFLKNQNPYQKKRARGEAVSYTHLTLPTILLV